MDADVINALELIVAKRAVDLIRETVGPDDPDFLELVENETDALQILRSCVRKALEQEAFVNGLKAYRNELKAREDRLQRSADTHRSIAKQIMQMVQKKSITDAAFGVSLSPGREILVIDDADILPTQLCRIKREPDKITIRKYLEQGEAVPGAHLESNPEPTLTIRVR